MDTYTKINVKDWSRKPQYDFFMEYDDPTSTITVEVDVAPLVHYATETQSSFFLLSLLASSQAINKIPEFRMRLLDGNPVLFDTIHARSTVARGDDSFFFCSFEYTAERESFLKKGKEAINKGAPKELIDMERINTAFYSVLPWFRFTNLQHAFKRSANHSIPKIAFGKYTKQPDGRFMMPIAITAHHAFVDGRHMAIYFKEFEAICKKIVEE